MLRSLRDDVQQTVTPRLLVGRSAACQLRLDDRHVSGEHATVAWTGLFWEVRDLGSRNGTYVDGTRLEPGQSARLRSGTRVAFGDPSEAWELMSEDPPTIMAVHTETQTIVTGHGDLLVLPDADSPEVSLYSEGADWWLDTGDGRPAPYAEGQLVQTSSGAWRIDLPSVVEGTPLMHLEWSLDSVELHFAVSRNEERVLLTVVARGVEVPLAPREHAYVLLTLARARRDDHELPSDSRGWRDRDDLERMLRLDSNALNVAIHRARQQLAAAGVLGAAQVVEVRRRKRRLGTDRFRIRPLGDE